MAFTDSQLQGLSAAYQRQQRGQANPADVANLTYAQKQGWKPSTIAPPMAPQTPTMPAGNTQLTSPSQVPQMNVTGQVGQTGAPGSFLYGTQKPPQAPAPAGGAGGGATSGAPGGAPVGGGTGSNSAFGAAFGQLMGKAQQSQALQDQRNLLINQLYDRQLTPDEISKLSPAAQQAVMSRDKSLMEYQISSINDIIKGRADQNTQALNYMMQGYQQDMVQAQQAHADATAKQEKAFSNFTALIDKYPDLGMKLSPEGIAAITNGQMPPPADIAAVYAGYKDSLAGQSLQAKTDATGVKLQPETKYQRGGVFDAKTGKFTPLHGSSKGSGSGVGGAGSVTTVSGQGMVAGHKIDPEVAGDVEDVLSGRNTLYNIRQTMGRSNAAAAYMKKMRDALRSIDPTFDFVSSDAGGKFVSSEFYQKSVSAINSVMPNIDKVVDLSNQVQRIGVAGVDSLIQKGAIQIGDKKVANFHEAQKLISDEIGLALGQGTVSDMKLQLGFDVTDPSVSQEVFASNMALVKEFIQNRKNGLNQQRYASPTASAPASGTTPTSDSGGSTYQGFTLPY